MKESKRRISNSLIYLTHCSEDFLTFVNSDTYVDSEIGGEGKAFCPCSSAPEQMDEQMDCSVVLSQNC